VVPRVRSSIRIRSMRIASDRSRTEPAAARASAQAARKPSVTVSALQPRALSSARSRATRRSGVRRSGRARGVPSPATCRRPAIRVARLRAAIGATPRTAAAASRRAAPASASTPVRARPAATTRISASAPPRRVASWISIPARSKPDARCSDERLVPTFASRPRVRGALRRRLLEESASERPEAVRREMHRDGRLPDQLLRRRAPAESVHPGDGDRGLQQRVCDRRRLPERPELGLRGLHEFRRACLRVHPGRQRRDVRRRSRQRLQRPGRRLPALQWPPSFEGRHPELRLVRQRMSRGSCLLARELRVRSALTDRLQRGLRGPANGRTPLR